MRIDGITVCTGRVYYNYFKQTLPRWADSLDSVTVVTTAKDEGVIRLAEKYKARALVTDILTEHGAAFNKGAGLCEAFASVWPQDWALVFDCDVSPPDSWRHRIRNQLQVGCLHGALRKYSQPMPIGFFQLWHASDLRTWRWPIFDNYHSHAGAYDMNFMELWDPEQRIVLDVLVRHFGPRRTHWFGNAKDAGSRMAMLLRHGVKRYRHEAQDGIGRLPIPDAPVVRISTRDELHDVAMQGVFAAKAILEIPQMPLDKGVSVCYNEGCGESPRRTILDTR